jgi:N6-adenosine-specific RNA methylase IME4
MTLEQIAALPVQELAAPHAHLHLWTTNAFLFECRSLFEAWGFEYKDMLVWVKPGFGVGNYWRVAHEFLLLGVCGNAPFLDHSKRSWFRTERLEHSEKPDTVREMIESVSPGPYLELFGRKRAEGWTVWGMKLNDEHQLNHLLVIHILLSPLL